jgi:spermidine synthase
LSDRPLTPSRRSILALFTLSGASGLIYEVIWARQFGLVFGNTTISTSVVLGAFMAGLAAGSALAGRFFVRRGNPMCLYAVFEGCIGAYALLLSSLLSGLNALHGLLFTEETSLATLTAVRGALAFLFLLIPTTMMGATLPLTTEYAHRMRMGHEDWNAGRLYGANTFGAALGAFAAGFALIELMGVHRSAMLAALFNFVVMGIGFHLARRHRVPAASPAQRSDITRGAVPLLALFAASGGLALAGEVVWTRALTLLLGNSTYAFSAILIVYLVGIALGSWTFAGWIRRLADPAFLIPPVIVAAGTWHVLAIEAIPGMYRLHDFLLADRGDSPTGAVLAAACFGIVVLVLMFPPAYLSGALFPLVTRIIGGEEGDKGEPVARAYAWNTVGAIGGSLLGGFVLAACFLHFHAIYVLALMFVVLSLYSTWAIGWTRHARSALATAPFALAVAAWSAWALGAPDLFIAVFKERRGDLEVVHHEPGLQGITSVLMDPRRPGPSALLLVDGRGMTTKVFATKAMAHIPIIVHGQADDTLVVCMGMGTTFRSALAHGGRVDVVELVPGVIDAFGEFYLDAEAVRENPRARVVVADGRNFLLLTRKKYDVITVDPPPPIDAAGVTHLYSREFLELMRDHLRPGGIVAHWIPAVHPSNGLRDIETFRMLVATFLDVFPHAKLLRGARGTGVHLLGSSEPIEIDSADVPKALENPAVRRDVFEYPWERVDAASLLAELPLPREHYATAPVLSDDRPRLEFDLIRSLGRGTAHELLRVSP